MWAKLRAFTLLEVLVAVAILGLGLTAILSGQFSAVKAVGHARNMNLVVGLVRCKMSEIEEELRIDGFQELDQDDSGVCCQGDETPNVACSWTVTKPIFPDPDYGSLDLDAKLEGTSLGKLQDADLGKDASISDVTKTLGGADGDMAGGGIGGITSMLMGMVYPDLKKILEASTRRVTVVVSWTEGARTYDIELVQWVTQPQSLPLDTPEDDGEGGGSSTGSGAGEGTGSGSSRGTGSTANPRAGSGSSGRSGATGVRPGGMGR